MQLYTEEHYQDLISSIDPIEEDQGFLVKRGDMFELGVMRGSKVRQCLYVVRENLDKIRSEHGGRIITGCGLPSPQGAIVATVGKYFGLKTALVTPRYKDGVVDLNRIEVATAQRMGAEIYGVKNPRPIGYKKEVEAQVKELNSFEIRFGMIGDQAMQPVILQTQNIPDHVEEITVISGSGLSAISIMIGCKKYGKKVKRINVVRLSPHIFTNMKMWYEPMPEESKFDGELNIVSSNYPYTHYLKKYGPYDHIYEAKAWDWMIKNREPSLNHLFWVVGVKNRDLSMVEPIEWKENVLKSSKL